VDAHSELMKQKTQENLEAEIDQEVIIQIETDQDTKIL